MIDPRLSDDDIELLKRALLGRCMHLGISPEGAAAQVAAGQLMDLFQLGIVDEQELARGPIPIAAAGRQH
ncbi:hypothetical protein OIU34_36975 [Pararhizobium sp. BT-229]|uniref:hypothetical protein n=1 Tax=Pararhizobium sp. BT-229 TaxID=2986923 RepID=UPI0021F7E034|nr:hypothetical protein [Pararhizobium sp. BT-229]MCV9967430.1 hypothetical protein [Pararhizobium sp. BT-229]